MTHVTCRLTAKNWDQLQNPTLGNPSMGYLYLFYEHRSACVGQYPQITNVEFSFTARVSLLLAAILYIVQYVLCAGHSLCNVSL